MKDLFEPITVKGDFITVSLLIWRRFKRPMPGLAEQVYDINVGLAELGPYLPLGTELLMPIPTARAAPVLDPITLW